MESTRSLRSWQLPDGIDELLPGAARHVEMLRRRLLDCAEGWGYELVIPPMLEFTDSLLHGVGEDLDLLTFKVPDQLSGRMLGFRADITPQVARMDAHSIGSKDATRLCYAGTILHTRSGSLASSRSPIQLGAEVFGAAGPEADLEVIALMLSMMEAAGLRLDHGITLDLGHADLFRHLVVAADCADTALELDLLDALQRKSVPDLKDLMQQLSSRAANWFWDLLALRGDCRILQQAQQQLSGIAEPVDAALSQLNQLAATVQARYPQLALYIDLAELRGYRYHTGVVFALYAQRLGEALARGGRYDNIGAAYGRARAATGFATDLRLVAALTDAPEQQKNAIAAPRQQQAGLIQAIQKLRAAGEIVIVSLDGDHDARCNRQLKLTDGSWSVENLEGSSVESEV
ncbi:MAG: ATP phosphoribosyltransferase regulatory subunit [Pseudomonadota bacterium]